MSCYSQKNVFLVIFTYYLALGNLYDFVDTFVCVFKCVSSVLTDEGENNCTANVSLLIVSLTPRKF